MFCTVQFCCIVVSEAMLRNSPSFDTASGSYNDRHDTSMAIDVCGAGNILKAMVCFCYGNGHLGVYHDGFWQCGGTVFREQASYRCLKHAHTPQHSAMTHGRYAPGPCHACGSGGFHNHFTPDTPAQPHIPVWPTPREEYPANSTLIHPHVSTNYPDMSKNYTHSVRWLSTQRALKPTHTSPTNSPSRLTNNDK